METLADLFVTMNGAISRFGTIRVFASAVSRDGMAPIYRYSGCRPMPFYEPVIIGYCPMTYEYGSMHYSPILHRYADGTHRAHIVGDAVQVVNSDGVAVATIKASELEYPTLIEGRVHPSGYVFYPELGLGSKKSLDEVAAGRVPPYCDKHVFARVDPALAGTGVMVLWLGHGARVVFQPDGVLIPHTVGQPLESGRSSFATAGLGNAG